MEQKPEVGRVVNEVKTIIEDSIATKEKELKKTKASTRKMLDVTEPGEEAGAWEFASYYPGNQRDY